MLGDGGVGRENKRKWKSCGFLELLRWEVVTGSQMTMVLELVTPFLPVNGFNVIMSASASRYEELSTPASSLSMDMDCNPNLCDL